MSTVTSFKKTEPKTTPRIIQLPGLAPDISKCRCSRRTIVVPTARLTPMPESEDTMISRLRRTITAPGPGCRLMTDPPEGPVRVAPGPPSMVTPTLTFSVDPRVKSPLSSAVIVPKLSTWLSAWAKVLHGDADVQRLASLPLTETNAAGPAYRAAGAAQPTSGLTLTVYDFSVSPS